ncbi:ankyrin repeat domain-containing protein [Marinicella gelatinilytica]|uniref:ankyrin repeat domain-containing protein n=1 Tax=Marinicella gelatinilytica TaxID=2996017 RepID=UPI002260A088|nr:ankyrin repeat domain-containing protein [Marinicella gelatinilytica]MCX7544444.1 ankyrin repeat domain-containing protein [Marinicella gelatinilytica]
MSLKATTKKDILNCCRRGQLAQLQQLLKQGISIDTVDSEEFAPLNIALRHGRWQVARYILQQNTLPNYATTPPLIAACQYNKDDTTGIDLIYRHTANINCSDSQNRTGLMTVCLLGHEKKFDFIVKHCEDVNRCDDHGMTALLDAVTSQSIKIVEKLIQAGADVNQCNHNNDNALLLAFKAKHPSPKLIQLLIDHKVNIYQQNKQAESPYEVAKQKHADLVKLLDIAIAKEQQIELPLFNDISSQDQTTTKTKPPNNMTSNKEHQHNWFEAVSKGNLGQLNRLLLKDVNINQTDDKDCTALIHAAGQGKRAVCSFLIEKGANINHRSRNGSTALSSAIISQSDNVVELLLRHQVKLNETGPGGYPYVNLAAAQWNESCLSRLVEAGASPLSKDPGRGNLYHNVISAAAYYSQTGKALQTLKLIHTYNIGINDRDDQGRTPLTLLARLGRHDKDQQVATLAHLLLKWHAKPNNKDSKGMTALDYCQQNQLANTRGVILSFTD